MLSSVETSVADRVRELTEEVARGKDLIVLDVRVRGRQGSQVVEVYVDSPTRLPVDALAKISRELGFLLDSESVFEGAYRLEVSSPGADQPLRHPLQYAKHKGRELELRVRGDDGDVRVVGRLEDSNADAITLSTPTGSRQYSHKDIIEGKVKLPW